MSLVEALIDAAAGRRRVPRTELWRAFRHAHPIEAGAPDARERLVSKLRALAADGRIALPAHTGGGWDRSAEPPFPEWVTLAPPQAAEPTFDTRAFPWAPELAFVRDVPRVDHPEDVLAVQRFLAAGGRERPMVPLRERSVQLFGDEKRLEKLLLTRLFGDGRLSLQVLRCFSLAPPLAFEAGPPGQPALVVENHHTWASFCRWNAREGAYSAVVYGAGSAFARHAVAFLAERLPAWAAPRVLYFGDLDRKGLEIPWRADALAEERGFRIEPAERWIRRLLARADEVSLPKGTAFGSAGAEWLAEPLRAEVLRHFSEGRRVPQELVGWEELEGVDGSG